MNTAVRPGKVRSITYQLLHMKRIFFIALAATLLLLAFDLPGVTVTTVAVSNITTNSARCKFTVTDPGNLPKTLGVCIGKGPLPTTDNTRFGLAKMMQGPTTYYSEMTGLAPGTLIYVRAYAILSTGTVYGNTLQFRTLAPAKPQ
jgi:hypothetical protein